MLTASSSKEDPRAWEYGLQNCHFCFVGIVRGGDAYALAVQEDWTRSSGWQG